jgi:hypothetical protein
MALVTFSNSTSFMEHIVMGTLSFVGNFIPSMKL